MINIEITMKLLILKSQWNDYYWNHNEM